MKTPKTNLLNLDRSGLTAFFSGLGEKSFRSQQVMKWIYHHGVTDFEQMSNLSKVLRQTLAEHAVVEMPAVSQTLKSVDGTVKWLIDLAGSGNAVETVFIPEPNRGTLCVSSQVGCSLNCTFCSTGAQGFSRNLATAEIVGQVLIAARALEHNSATNRRITNVVLMGMGEPLLNFDQVVPAMSVMCDDFGFGLAGKRVTLSTAGLIPGIEKLADTIDVSLAVSLHAPNDALRNELVPLNKKYPISQLMQACRDYLKGKNKARITFEYTMIDGVNDSEHNARELVGLLRSVPSKLNLIPFNPFPGTRYQRSTDRAIERFQRIILNAGLVATLRKTRGDDIDAACGQLAGRVIDRTRRSERLRAQAVGA